MPESSPLAENKQISTAAVPVAGRSSGTRLPAREQELFATENSPRAATSRSTSLDDVETPAVAGSTTTMSWATAEADALVREMEASTMFCAMVIWGTVLEVELSGLRTWTGMLPTAATSAGEIGAVHAVT